MNNDIRGMSEAKYTRADIEKAIKQASHDTACDIIGGLFVGVLFIVALGFAFILF